MNVKVLCLFVVLLLSCLIMTEAAPQGFRQGGGGRRPGRTRPNRGRLPATPGIRSGSSKDRTSPYGHWKGSDPDGYSPNGR